MKIAGQMPESQFPFFSPLGLKDQNIYVGISLVVQWLRIRLPMQGTRV